MRPRYLNIAIAVLSLIIAWIWLAYGGAVAEFVRGIERTGPGHSPEDRTTGLLAFGILVPLINGALGVGLGKLTGLTVGGATLLGVLAASASYIAAPAAIRVSLPDANPTLYLTSSLAITFPFNITLGIPVYLEIARRLYS